MEKEINWIDINDKKPPYCEQVLVVRPNKYSGKIDILLGYLHKAEPKGAVYGRIHEEKITYGDYWSFPVIQPFDKVTHWMPLPKPPLNGDSLPKTLQKINMCRICSCKPGQCVMEPRV